MFSIFTATGFFLCGGVGAAEKDNADACLKPEDCDVFYGKKEQLYLHGKWKFKEVDGKPGYDFSDEGMKENFWKRDCNDGAWQDMAIPKKLWCRPGRADTVVPGPGIGYLRKSFTVPEKYKDGRAIITFSNLAWEPVIWINGKEAARPLNMIPGKCADIHNIDITDFIEFGKENNITVRFYIKQSGGYDKNNTNGIFGPCLIEFVPQIYCKNIFITPKLPGTVNVKCTVFNGNKKSSNAKLKGEIRPWAGSPEYQKRISGSSSVSKFDINCKSLNPGDNDVEFSVKINNPVLWDTFNPFLYSLKVYSDDKVIGWERFGLREFSVKNQYFYLNGNKIFLFGISPECTALVNLQQTHFDFYHNRNNFLRKYLLLLKQANLNTIFRIEKIPPKAFLDICDELGILQIPTPDVLLECEYSDYAEKLLKSDREAFLNETLKRNAAAAYNHPSVVAYTPEGECNRVPGVSTDFHRYVKVLRKYDSSRLFSSAQSGMSSGQDENNKLVPLIPPPPFDFFNPAALQGSCGGAFVHTLIPDYLKQQTLAWNSKFYAGNQKPSVYTEALYYYGYRQHTQYWLAILSRYGKVIENGKINKKLYCELYSLPAPENARYLDFHYCDVNVAGIRNSLDRDKLYPLLAEHVGEMVEMARMSDEYVQGFGMVSSPEVSLDEKAAKELDPQGMNESPLGKVLSKKNAPVFICADMQWKHNFFAGKEYQLRVFCFNYGSADIKNAAVKIELKDGGSRILEIMKIPAGDLLRGDKKEIVYLFKVNPLLKTGDYSLSFALVSDDKTYSENIYNAFILGKENTGMKISTNKSIGVIDAGDHYLYDFNPSRLLDVLGVKSEIVSNYNDLKKYDLVIIAQGMAGLLTKENNAKLSAYLENGGRALCLEQNRNIPLLQNVKIQSVGAFRKLTRIFGEKAAIGIHADIIEPEHPVLKGINKPENWKKWSALYGKIYSYLAMPLNEGVIIAGNSNGFTDKGVKEDTMTRLGGLLCEIRIGKGLLILSQIDATSQYGFDAVATAYLNNLIKYVTGNEWDGRYACSLEDVKK